MTLFEALEKILSAEVVKSYSQFDGYIYETLAQKFPEETALLRKAIYSMKEGN